jgi:hypothetical protein
VAQDSRFGILIEAQNRAGAALAEAQRQVQLLGLTAGGAAGQTKKFDDASAALSRTMSAVQRDVQNSVASMTQFGSVLTTIGGPVGAVALAVTGLGAAMLGLAQHAGSVQEQMQNVTERTGLTASTVGALTIAANEAGSSFEAISPGLDLFNRKIGEAAQGNKDAQKAFSDLGVEIRDRLTGALKSSDQLIEQTGKALDGIAEPSERARLAMELFGRSGSRFLTVLSADLEENRKRAEELGLVYTGQLAESAKQADQSFDKLGTATKGLTNSLGVIAAISINPLVEQFAKLAENVAKSAKASADYAALVRANPQIFYAGFTRTADGGLTGGFQVRPSTPTSTPYGPMPQEGPRAAQGYSMGSRASDAFGMADAIASALLKAVEMRIGDTSLVSGAYDSTPMKGGTLMEPAAEAVTRAEQALQDSTWDLAHGIGGAVGELVLAGDRGEAAIRALGQAIVSFIAQIASQSIGGPAGGLVSGLIGSFGALFQSGASPQRSPQAGGSVTNHFNVNLAPNSDRKETRRWIRESLMPELASELGSGRY